MVSISIPSFHVVPSFKSFFKKKVIPNIIVSTSGSISGSLVVPDLVDNFLVVHNSATSSRISVVASVRVPSPDNSSAASTFSEPQVSGLVSFASLSVEVFKDMATAFACPTVAGFSYLRLFREGSWPDVAFILRGSPTVFDVVSLAIQNRDSVDSVRWVKHDVRNSTRLVEIKDDAFPDKPFSSDWNTPVDEALLAAFDREAQLFMRVTDLLFAFSTTDSLFPYKFI